ncbi:hypothetical protein O6H91_06G038100 [Diphasiastrum complanatum]|uniref:Uncharacterized protein n=1 Tax=Diphasiastrum complanatum TaxID=34168 RepID=A0ACC2DCZ2_DIPCM|nr:hypothetical protein O6H91_Y521300 [Diphasiastrum complanatum]KAJ7552005.1 hypothetical protein O6H91_06G038100 [Diphasiastrum complanatum]
MGKIGEGSSKWNGAVKETIAAPLSRAWEIVSDFCGLRKWMPTIERCEKLEGQPYKPGCVRHVVGTGVDRMDGEKYSWVKERLLTFDPSNHLLKYMVEDGNLSLDGYVGTIQLSKCSANKTVVNWSFEMNPIRGCEEGVVVGSITSGLQCNLRNLELAACSEI